jgi:uncharacterized protein (DUF983 family)
MGRPVDVDAVLAGRPSPGTLLRRGITKKCPRCGSGGIFHGWFHMEERCPTCGYLFEREPGFFVGAYLINFAIAEGFLFVLLMAYLVWKNNHPEAGVLVPIGIGASIGVIGPMVCYPFSRTIWSAIDLLMTPLEVPEIVAAADHVAEPEEPGVGEPGVGEPGAEEPPGDGASAGDGPGPER